jgi:hypothetical protein
VSYTGSTAFSSNWPQLKFQYRKAEDGAALHYTRIISPKLVNEFTFSGRKILEGVPDIADFPLTNVQTTTAPGMAGFPQLYTAANLSISSRSQFRRVPARHPSVTTPARRSESATTEADGRYPRIVGTTHVDHRPAHRQGRLLLNSLPDEAAPTSRGATLLRWIKQSRRYELPVHQCADRQHQSTAVQPGGHPTRTDAIQRVVRAEFVASETAPDG